MSAVRSFWGAACLAGFLTLWGTGGAAALPVAPGAGAEMSAHRVAMVCGPNRCFARPFWRYGPGVGFQRSPRFGYAPRRPFGFRPFGFGRFGDGRFGGGRRW